MNMTPTVNKILHYLVLAVMLLGGLGPTVVQLTPFLPPAWVAPISHVVAVAAALVLYLSQSPLLSPLLPLRQTVPSKPLGVTAMGASIAGGCMMLASAAMLVACSSLASFEQGISTGSKLVVPSENFACTVAEDVDPSGGTAVCQEIDTTGALVGTVLTIAEDAPSIAAAVAHTSVGQQAQIRANRKVGAK